MMRTRLPATVLRAVCMLVLLAVAFPSSAGAQGEKSTTITIFTINRVPIYNIFEVGTLRADLTGSPAGPVQSFTINWSFRGLTNGAPASASGTGSGTWDPSSSTLTITMGSTEPPPSGSSGITSWNMPGFPQLQNEVKIAYARELRNFPPGPSALWLVTVNDTVVGNIVTDLPLLVFPQLANPLGRPTQTYVESSIGAGSFVMRALPGAGFAGGRPSSFQPFQGAGPAVQPSVGPSVRPVQLFRRN